MAEVAPAGSIAKDDDAPFARINALGRAMRQAIHKKKGIAGLHAQLHRALNLVDIGLLAVHLVFGCVWMREVGFVAAGDDHGCAIALANIGQRHQHIDLAAVEAAVVIAELRALGAFMPAAVQADRLSRPAYAGEALIDEKRSMIVVECARAADECLDLVDPGWMVDELLESCAAFIDLLQVQPFIIAIGMSVHIAVPLTWRHGQQRVDARIQFAQLACRKRVLQQQIAAQVEEICLAFADHSLSPVRHSSAGRRWRPALRPASPALRHAVGRFRQVRQSESG